MPAPEDAIAIKPLKRFNRLTASLETLILSIAQDWEAAADPRPEDSVIVDDGPTKPIHGKIRKAQMLFTELHSSTRKTHSAIEIIRAKVATAKQSMDVNHLQLENLLYERDHLSRETQLCKDFTMSELSKMEEAEEQGFLEDVDVLQTPEEHTKNLAILKEQKEKRKTAQLELNAAQIRVKAAKSSLNETREYLDKLPDHVKDVEKAIEPLKKSMPWRPGSRRGRHEQATDLPGPLYTLYCQLEAYCESVLAETGSTDESGAASSSITYDGGENAAGPKPAVAVTLVPAKVYVSAAAKAAAAGPKDASDSAEVPGTLKSSQGGADQKDEGGSAEPDGKRLKRHHDQDGGGGLKHDGAGTRQISRREAGRLTLEALRTSPTEVLLTLNHSSLEDGAVNGTAPPKGKGGSFAVARAETFSVRFSFLPALGIVAVTACPQPGGAGCKGEHLLANLFPNDTGAETPNPANHYGEAARASPTGDFRYPADVPCRPYRWAQWLAGLHFPPRASSLVQPAGGGVKAELAIEPSVRSAMAALRSRVRTRLALDVQLEALSTGRGPSPLQGLEWELHETETDKAVEKVELSSWKELTGSELQQAANAFQESDASISGGVDVKTEEALPSSSDALPTCREPWERFGARYFKGTIKTSRGSSGGGGGGKDGSVHIQVEVPAEYPLRPSLISLAAEKPGAEEAVGADLLDELRTITNEVNAHYDTLLTEDVSRWDHLLSHQLVLVMECLAPKSALVGRLKRGRMRRKPVLFDRLERKFVHR